MSTITTPHGYKLGKKEARRPEGLGEFKSYFAEGLPKPPPFAHYGHEVTAPWDMYANGPDPQVTLPGTPPGWGGCGDCVEACKAHSLITANFIPDEKQDAIPQPTANEVVQQYCAYQQCIPEQLFANPDEYDNGEDIATSLQGWQSAPQYGEDIGVYAPVDYTNVDDLKNGLYLGGGLVLGIQIQEAQEEQFPGPWSWVPGSPVLGGHCIWLTGYTATELWLITWGAMVQTNWEFIANAADEAWVVVSGQAIKAGKGPTGLNIAALKADLAALDN